jgi:hypothetical protein
MRFLLVSSMALVLLFPSCSRKDESRSVAGAQSASDHEEFEFVRQQIKTSHGFVAKNGVVPDKGTAIAIAYAGAVPVYGKQTIEEEKPLRAELEDGTWIVLGTLKRGFVGGTLIIQIEQATGRVLYVSHSM